MSRHPKRIDSIGILGVSNNYRISFFHRSPLRLRIHRIYSSFLFVEEGRLYFLFSQVKSGQNIHLTNVLLGYAGVCMSSVGSEGVVSLLTAGINLMAREILKRLDVEINNVMQMLTR